MGPVQAAQPRAHLGKGVWRGHRADRVADEEETRAKAHTYFLGKYVIVVISLTIGPTPLSGERCTKLRLRTPAPGVLFSAVNVCV